MSVPVEPDVARGVHEPGRPVASALTRRTSGPCGGIEGAVDGRFGHVGPSQVVAAGIVPQA